MFRTVTFTDGGIVLWSREAPEAPEVPNSVLNDFISTSFIEGSGKSAGAAANTANVSGFTVKYSRNRDLGVTTAMIYPSLAPVKQSDAIVSDISKIFASVNGEDANPEHDFDIERFESLVQLRLKDVESESAPEIISEPQPSSGFAEKEAPVSPAVKAELPRSKPKTGTAAAAAAAAAAAKKKKPKKQNRRWDGIEDNGDDAPLDYSEANAEASGSVPTADVSLDGYGTRSGNGFEVSALSDELNDILQSSAKPAKEENFGFLKGFMGGKTISDKDLDKALKAMEDHLISKNVAQEAAAHLTEQVRKDLIGSKTASWTSVSATVRQSMTKELRSILTPKTSVDMLLEVQQSRKKAGRPYVISVVGVNGVGKSTNLGKIGFWLLQNDLKVLVAACDTFRSGAVEQLKVHVERLSQLTEREGLGRVELFSQGYGKDAAVIAQKAVEHGQKHNFDVVLIDTAGRRHNDERLMSSLEKFGKLAQPDKIIMVGEALVGTDSVQQARNFDAAFGAQRHLDFFLISKVDTVGDMLGTLVNMTYSTGVPVLFVGVGQNYTDLRTLSVEWAVTQLLA